MELSSPSLYWRDFMPDESKDHDACSPSSQAGSSAASQAKLSRFLLLGVLVVALAAGGVATAALWRFANRPYDPTPIPRPVANAPYKTSPHDVVETMLELAEVGQDDLVYDLGCGDGRIVITAAKKYGCRAMGFDFDPERVKESEANVAAAGVAELVTIKEQDMFKLDFSDADVVTIYLLPDQNAKLIPQLRKLKPGSRIVSHDFRIKGIQDDKEVEFVSQEDNQKHYLYLFTTPLKNAPKDQRY